VSNKPGHRGEREVSRKTIARGMPGETGVTVVTMLVCFVLFRTRGCGRIWRPAFPAPSVISGRMVFAKTRTHRAARTRSLVLEIGATSLRGAKRRSNPLFLCVARWIASRSLSSGAHSRDPLARNDTQTRLSRGRRMRLNAPCHTAIASKSFKPAKIYSLKLHPLPAVARRNNDAD